MKLAVAARTFHIGVAKDWKLTNNLITWKAISQRPHRGLALAPAQHTHTHTLSSAIVATISCSIPWNSISVWSGNGRVPTLFTFSSHFLFFPFSLHRWRQLCYQEFGAYKPRCGCFLALANALTTGRPNIISLVRISLRRPRFCWTAERWWLLTGVLTTAVLRAVWWNCILFLWSPEPSASQISV